MISLITQGRKSSAASMGRISQQTQAIGVLLCLLSSALCNPVLATVYSVGPGEDCTHTSLLAALNAAVADATTGPHIIRIAAPSINLEDEEYEISNPVRDIFIFGGLPNCSTFTPAPGARTRLIRNPAHERRVLDVFNSIANPRRTVVLSRLDIEGGNPDTGVGGGLIASGRVTVALDDTRIENNRAPDGGGVGIFSSTVDTELAAVLRVASNSRICNNEAYAGDVGDGNGGGVWMAGAADLELWHGQICDNEASRHGGGVFMLGQANRLLLDPLQDQVVEIAGNRAGISVPWAANRGQGGGIYAGPRSSISYQSNLTPVTQYSLVIQGNEANFGGGLFINGSADPGHGFTTAILRNAIMIANVARTSGGGVELRNAADLRLVKHGTGQCQLFAPAPCVVLASNRVEINVSGPSVLAAGGFARLRQDAGAPRPALRVAGALFTGNEDTYGTAAVVAASADSSIRILRSVFIDNAAGGKQSQRSLISSEADYLFAYNTVLNNDVTILLLAQGGEVDATGSILYAPGRFPFGSVLGGTLVHNGCLLSHTTDFLPPGVTVGTPLFGPGWEPLVNSPAVDRCGLGVGDSFWPAGADAYGLPAPFDVPSVPNTGGPWDLGAVELRIDAIFSDRFQP